MCKNVKIFLKRIIGWIVLVSAIVISLNRIGLLFQVLGSENRDVDYRSGLYFYLPNNTVDVLFLGNSHTYCSYNPKWLFDDYGISSAGLATSAQSMQNSYYLLKEAIKNQKPEVVVLDYYTIATAVDENTLNFRLHYTSGISILPDISINKYIEYNEFKKMHYGCSDEIGISDVVAFLEFRNDYDRDISFDEFYNLIVSPQKEYATLGYYPTDENAHLTEIIEGIESNNYMPLKDTIEFKYFLKINELCKNEKIKLLMVRSLYSHPDFDDYNLISQFEDYMDDENISHINFFELINELEIDVDKDFRDEDHLNSNGAVKTTNYLGDYLCNHFKLVDHRGDEKYSIWENNSYDYEKYLFD